MTINNVKFLNHILFKKGSDLHAKFSLPEFWLFSLDSFDLLISQYFDIYLAFQLDLLQKYLMKV